MDFSELKKAAEDYRDRPSEANFEGLAAEASDEERGVLALLAEREHLLAENEVLKDAGRIALSGVSFSKLELIERAVSSVKGPSKYRSKHGIARWVLVKGAFGVGSGVANALCLLFGFDPDENLRS